MPGGQNILYIAGIVLQYILVILLYGFLYIVIKLIYNELKPPKPQEVPFAKLLVMEKGNLLLNQVEYILGESTTIGRSEKNNIVLDESFVSYEHACITGEKNEYMLTDLGSTNGTYLNGERIRQDKLLSNGDLIKIGEVTFRFER